jgi:hypothetical protein
MKIEIHEVNPYNPSRGMFYLDKNGEPTKERLGALLWAGSWEDSIEVWEHYDSLGIHYNITYL